MDKIFLVYDEYCYDACNEPTLVYVCATMEIAIRKVKERLEWYLENSYLNQFVDNNLNVIDSELDEDSVEIFIGGKDTSLNLHIAEENVIDK